MIAKYSKTKNRLQNENNCHAFFKVLSKEEIVTIKFLLLFAIKNTGDDEQRWLAATVTRTVVAASSIHPTDRRASVGGRGGRVGSCIER